MAEEFAEKLIEKVWEYVFLDHTVHPEYKNLMKKAEARRYISEELDQTSKCLPFLLKLSANRRRISSSSELDIMN